jgi:hypothetical protein
MGTVPEEWRRSARGEKRRRGKKKGGRKRKGRVVSSVLKSFPSDGNDVGTALLHDARPLLPLDRGSSRRFLRASRRPAPDSTPASWNSSEDYPDHPRPKAEERAVKNRSPSSYYPRVPLTKLLQI